ncbi:hypothetical protein QSV08_09870 [Maribacter sp. BPC-D8]|uniref:DUF6892 domain-containing protein n=1 Tax=Maribacter sp. BPC-D8 TaxID=3053613 RepID=UPI002B462799|nr:hypothetical protein [Maribacter sp. BPC-D8]WRI31543.1 hypothetical protein QSV08_09870 [Maribacter sp. BPC-D8]
MALPLTENETLLKNIAQLKEVDFENKDKATLGKKIKGTSYQAIRQNWKVIIKQNQDDIERLYERGLIEDWTECRTKRDNDFTFENEVYALLLNWLERVDWSNLKEVKTLFKYTELVSNSDYGLNSLVLLNYHKRLLAVIKTLITKENFTIVDKLHSDNLGSLIENLINLYFYHTRNSYNKGHLEQFDIDRREIATVIPEFMKAFPENNFGLIMSILKDNTENLVETCADLLQFFVTNKVKHNYDFSSKLFGRYEKPSDSIYKNTPKILNLALENSDFSDGQVAYLIEEVLLMNLDITSKEHQEKQTIEHLANLKKHQFDTKVITKYEKELSELETNFDTKYAKSWTTAVRRVAISQSISKSIEILIAAFPKHPKTKILAQLLQEVTTYANRPKVYDLSQKPSIAFKDLHLKYLVIEELMYNQELLKPKFDIQHFAQEYAKREIDIEDEGYEVIPEVKKYFKNLDIPIELLAEVHTLYQDSGLGGGSEFMYNLQPFWDPGCGDEVFKLTNKAIEDFALLPNLKKIIGLENSNPSKKMMEALEHKKVLLEKEED